jgi:hypothetical protein
MKICNRCKIEKDLLEFNKRSVTRDGLSNRCRVCVKEVTADITKVYNKQYYSENREKCNLLNREWYLANKSYINSVNAQWKVDNKSVVNAYCAKRKAAKINRTPNWLTEGDLFLIAEIYDQAQQLTLATGVDHHVDHTIPLQGDNVSGLHTPENLQIILASENLSKSNSYAVGG